MNFNLNMYYPIGTICMIVGHSEPFMIIGYHKNIYSDEIKTYDYEACSYPYGTLTNNNIFFNSEDIEKIIFEGYKEEKILTQNFNEDFDNNILKDRIIVDDDIVFVQNDSYEKLLFDMDSNVLIAEDAIENDTHEKENIERYTFDENGLLVAIDE